MFRVRWKEDYTILTAIDRNADDAAFDTVMEIAEALVEDIRSHWSASSPSAVGTPPGVRAGYLDEGTKVDDQGRTAGRFAGSDAQTAFVRIDTGESGRQYAQAVQTYSGRPFFDPAMERIQARFPRLMKEFFGKLGI